MRKLSVIAICIPVIYSAAFSGDSLKNIQIKGDLRYRHEMIKQENKNARHRHRIRARLGMYAKANEMIDVGIQMATGSDDPVSTNQTLDNAFSTKDFRLDMAYFKFHHEKLSGFQITGGKFKNPFFKPGKSELLWDSDWNPEGSAAILEQKINNVTFTLIGAGLWIDERSSSDDSYLAAGQGVIRWDFSCNNKSVAIGGGSFNYVNVKGFSPFFNSKDSFGNSVTTVEIDSDTILQYASDFKILELFTEATWKFNSIPVIVMGDFVTNTYVDNHDIGWLVGL